MKINDRKRDFLFIYKMKKIDFFGKMIIEMMSEEYSKKL